MGSAGPLSFGVVVPGAPGDGRAGGPEEPYDQWATWQRSGKAPPPGPGCDLWHHPAAALDRAAALGCDEVALEVEWARVEPAPDRPDPRALDRYSELLAACAERGMAPVVTLFDVAHPAWLGEEYWLTPGSPDRFAAHVARVAGRLGEACGHWVTVRQPNLVALAGWVGGHQPPGRFGALSDAFAVVDNLLTAHVLAYEVLHDLRPDAEVAMGLRAGASYEWHRLLVDLVCARGLGIDRDGLDAWIDGRRSDGLSGKALAARRLAAAISPYGESGSRWRRRSPRRVVDAVYGGAHPRPLDGLVVGWRCPRPGSAAWPTRVPALRPAAGRTGPTDDASDLVAWCREQARLTPGLPLWVEGGASGRRRDHPAGWTRTREDVLRAQVEAVADVAQAGATVAGYRYHALAGGWDPSWPGTVFGLYETEACAEGVRWPGAADPSGAATFRRAVASVRSRDRPAHLG